MSVAVGAASRCSKDMAREIEEKERENVEEIVNEEEKNNLNNNNISRHMSEASLYTTEDEEDDEEGKGLKAIDLGPQVSIRDQLDKDKDDESLRRWKEQLLAGVDLNSVGENLEPEVKILSLSILSPGRQDIVLPIPTVSNIKGLWFTLKEGIRYKLKFAFSVSNNIVSGLKYRNTVWKTGVKVDNNKEMLGTFSPRLEPYTYEVYHSLWNFCTRNLFCKNKVCG